MAKPVPLKDVIERQKVAPPRQVDETYAVAMLVRRVLMVLRDKGKEKILEKQRYRRGKMRVPTDDTDETDVIFKRGRGDFFRRGLHGRDGIRNKEPGGICGICGIRGPVISDAIWKSKLKNSFLFCSPFTIFAPAINFLIITIHNEEYTQLLHHSPH